MPKKLPHTHPRAALEAVNQKNLPALQAALPHVSIASERDRLLSEAAITGWVEAFDVLIPVVSMQGHRCALVDAAQFGQLESLKRLSTVASRADCTDALVSAVIREQVDCARYLVPRADLDDVVRDCIDDHFHQVDMLAPFLSPPALRHLATVFATDQIPQTTDRLRALDTGQQLDEATPEVNKASPRRF